MAAHIVPLRPLAVVAAYSIVAAVTIGFLYHGRALLIPLAIAILIWHLINALAAFCHRLTPGKRRLPGWLSYMAALLTIFGALTIMVELIMDNVAEVSEAAPGYEASLHDLLNTMYDLVGLKSAPSFAQIIEQISVGSVVSAVAGTLGGLAGSAGIVVVYVIFLLLEQSIFERKLRALLGNPGRAERLHRLLARIAAQIEGYLWVKTLTSLLAGAVSFAIMWAVGVDFAAFWALMIFLLELHPDHRRPARRDLPVAAGAGAVRDHRAVPGHEPGARRRAVRGQQPDRAAPDGPQAASEPLGDHPLARVLGRALGRGRHDPLRPDHGDPHDHLRPFSPDTADRDHALERRRDRVADGRGGALSCRFLSPSRCRFRSRPHGRRPLHTRSPRF